MSGYLPGLGPDDRLVEQTLMRLPNGQFAPRGRGLFLKPGKMLRVPHKDGREKHTVRARANRDGKSVTLETGPDKGFNLPVVMGAEAKAAAGTGHAKLLGAAGNAVASPRRENLGVTAETVAKAKARNAAFEKGMRDLPKASTDPAMQAWGADLSSPAKQASARKKVVGLATGQKTYVGNANIERVDRETYVVTDKAGRGVAYSGSDTTKAAQAALSVPPVVRPGRTPEQRASSAKLDEIEKKWNSGRPGNSVPNAVDSGGTRGTEKKMAEIAKGDWVRDKKTGQVKKVKDVSVQAHGGGAYDIAFRGRVGNQADHEPLGVKVKLTSADLVGTKADGGRSTSGEVKRSKIIVDGEHVADVVQHHAFGHERQSNGLQGNQVKDVTYHVTRPGGRADHGSSRARPGDAERLTRVRAFNREDAVGEFLGGKAAVKPKAGRGAA